MKWIFVIMGMLTAVATSTVIVSAQNPFSLDSISLPPAFPGLHPQEPDSTVINTLTETDFYEVAEELGVEVAAIKAVVEIEAGKTHQGFSAPMKPLINFDLGMFRKLAPRYGVKLSDYYASHPSVFKAASRTQSAVNKRLESAMTINRDLAAESTFWGMFQIGGFNWQKCGTESIDEFITLMSRSERDQLELFARFITNTGLLKYLKSKNWAAFARGYNGNSYAARGYHTKLANAYRKYKGK
ncbi:MAG: N-acetylmuramidase family protein [Lachnoclostridium sp.]|nr:N-acetylmuramidase family protein [Lachnoclostridium sp.]